MVGLSKIQEDVRIVLDHNEVQESVFTSADVEDQLQLDDIIENQVEAGVRLTLQMSPRNYIKWEVLTTGTGAAGEGYYAVPIPQDFVRFGAAKMTDWAKSVDTYGSVADEEYTMQQSEFAGVRATRRKPMAFMCEKPAGGNEMQLYPLKEDDTLQFFTYCKQQKLTENSTTHAMELDISDTLYQPFIYITAALVAEVLKDTEKSNELMSGAKMMLTIPEEAVVQPASE